MTGFEAYYRPGPFTFGSEYFLQRVHAPASGDPLFHGGDAVATWLITGETRTYNTRGGYFNQISPKRPVFAGGPGAWEIVGHVSNVDLDGGAVTGGKFWRFTPMAELVRVGPRPARVRLRLRIPRSVRSRWQDALLPDPASTPALTRGNLDAMDERSRSRSFRVGDASCSSSAQ